MNVTQTYHPENLIVCRDGQIDDEYYDAIYSERRKAVFQAAGRELVHFTFVAAPLQIGKGMLYLLSNVTEQAKN